MFKYDKIKVVAALVLVIIFFSITFRKDPQPRHLPNHRYHTKNANHAITPPNFSLFLRHYPRSYNVANVIMLPIPMLSVVFCKIVK